MALFPDVQYTNFNKQARWGDFTFNGRPVLTVKAGRRTFHPSGRGAAHTVYTVMYADAIEPQDETVTATKFNSTAVCKLCGKKYNRCECED